MRLSPKSIVIASVAALATMLTGCTHTATEAQGSTTSPAALSPSPVPSASPTVASASPTVSSTPPASTTPASPTPTPSVSISPAAPTPAGIVLQKGSHSAYVAQLQAWLYQSVRGTFYGSTCGFDQSFGPLTQKALEQWQKAASQPMTGTIQIGSPEWQLLQREATANRLPAGISAASVKYVVTYGKPIIDAGKSPSCARVLQPDAKSPHGVKITLSEEDSYAGRALGNDGKYHNYITPNGMFEIGWRDPDGIKAYSHTFFHAPMPWATCFIGHDVCFHYDQSAPSHGCVHVHNMTAAHELYLLPIGTKVNVHA